MPRGITKNFFLVSAVTAGLLFSGCSSQEEDSQGMEDAAIEAVTPEVENDIQAFEEATDQDRIETDEDDSEQGDMEAALAERDQFYEDQQLPMDGSHLSAVTSEQKQFVAEQRAHIESQGGVWTPEYETLILALTGDACESAILNHHEVDNSTVQFHIESSPLFLGMISEDMNDAEREKIEANMAEIMVYGMQHMCPADYSQWVQAVIELYPEHINVQ